MSDIIERLQAKEAARCETSAESDALTALVEAREEKARLLARIAELERKSAHLKRCWFLAMGYSDIPDESTEQVLTRKVAEQRTAMDAMERKAARWDECEQRASFIEQSAGLFHWRIRTGCGVSTFAAAIDAAIAEREGGNEE